MRKTQISRVLQGEGRDQKLHLRQCLCVLLVFSNVVCVAKTCETCENTKRRKRHCAKCYVCCVLLPYKTREICVNVNSQVSILAVVPHATKHVENMESYVTQ